MVCDVRRFSTMSEPLPAEEIVRTLGQWFQDVGNVVRRAGGTIDKFVGDGVLAYWTRKSEEGRESRGALDSALSLLKAADKHRWRLPEETHFLQCLNPLSTIGASGENRRSASRGCNQKSLPHRMAAHQPPRTLRVPETA